MKVKKAIQTILEEYGYESIGEADEAEGWGSDTVVPGCCLACGEVEASCEPDAEDNTCHVCGENKVKSIIMLVMEL